MRTMIFTATTHVATYGDAMLIEVGTTIYTDDNTPYRVLEAEVLTKNEKFLQYVKVEPISLE